MNINRIFLSLLGLLYLSTVNSQNISDKYVQILDSIEAAQQIIDDDIDNFFERVDEHDMFLQMQSGGKEKKYSRFLQSDVEDFSKNEKEILGEVFDEILAQINAVSPHLIPTNIKLIKTKGRHYGEGVYYTREECIVIPRNVISRSSSFKEVMIHEIWHIISRYKPELRKKIYHIFGFQPICEGIQMQLNPSADYKMLLNPDGTNFDFAIKIDSQWVMPLIFSHANYNGGTFMQNLNFGLFKINEDNCQVDFDDKLPTSSIKDYVEIISDNTSYFIHPDEVSADHFIFAVLSNSGKQYNFSEYGQQLLAKTLEVLKSEKELFPDIKD